MDAGRRFFLRGGVTRAPAAQPAPPRPPWAGAEDGFVRACTRCDACVEACPEGILKRGDGGFPVISFDSAGCTFCQRCAEKCSPKALRTLPDRVAWSWRAAIGADCLALRKVECRVCGEMCDLGAIRFRPGEGGIAQPIVSVADCTGCGQCVATCPTRSIQMKVPASS